MQGADEGACGHTLFVRAVHEYATAVWSVSDQTVPASELAKKMLASGQSLVKWKDAIAPPATRKRAALTELRDPRQGLLCVDGATSVITCPANRTIIQGSTLLLAG